MYTCKYRVTYVCRYIHRHTVEKKILSHKRRFGRFIIITCNHYYYLNYFYNSYECYDKYRTFEYSSNAGLTGQSWFFGEVHILGEHRGNRRHFFLSQLSTAAQLLHHLVDDPGQDPYQIDVLVSESSQLVSQCFNKP